MPRDAGNNIIDDEDISLLPLQPRARTGHRATCRRKRRFSVALSVYDNLDGGTWQFRDDLYQRTTVDRAKVMMG